MDPLFFYPIILISIFIHIKKMVVLSNEVSMAVYILIAIFYTTIKPIYGILSAILLIFYDRVSKTHMSEGFSQNNEKSYPRIIYQTWHSKILPPKMADCVDKLKRDNPAFEHHLYDNAMCRAFIKDNYDKKVLDAYDELLPGAFKADLWRYCILYKTGGIYLDIKFQCEPGFSLNGLTGGYVREYNHLGSGLYNHIIYTGCICSQPNNPVFMKCIDKIVDNCNTKYYGPEHTSPTGPYLFASMMESGDIENSKYAYYEENGIGYIRNIEDKRIILSHYPEYRKEQKSYGKGKYWKDAWLNREVYSTG